QRDDLYQNSDEDWNDKELRRIKVEITEGMINQSLIALTTARKRGTVQIDEDFHITLPDGEILETRLVSPGNRFKHRGFVKRFFTQTGAKPGDFIFLNEESQGKWKLEIKNDGILYTEEEMKELLTQLTADNHKG
ncbi:MAG: hypothetical protein ABGX43_06505, partial [Nitrospinaceae bacterium]